MKLAEGHGGYKSVKKMEGEDVSNSYVFFCLLFLFAHASGSILFLFYLFIFVNRCMRQSTFRCHRNFLLFGYAVALLRFLILVLTVLNLSLKSFTSI